MGGVKPTKSPANSIIFDIKSKRVNSVEKSRCYVGCLRIFTWVLLLFVRSSSVCAVLCVRHPKTSEKRTAVYCRASKKREIYK